MYGLHFPSRQLWQAEQCPTTQLTSPPTPKSCLNTDLLGLQLQSSRPRPELNTQKPINASSWCKPQRESNTKSLKLSGVVEAAWTPKMGLNSRWHGDASSIQPETRKCRAIAFWNYDVDYDIETEQIYDRCSNMKIFVILPSGPKLYYAFLKCFFILLK